jgi:glycosyltransferase involved in cell wall biosynthesis
MVIGHPIRKVAVLIPALNEEQALPHVLAAIPRGSSATGAATEAAHPRFVLDVVIVVDNGSTDRTAEVAREGGAMVVVEDHRGYGAACLAGIAFLRTDPPDMVVFMDADYSDDPTQLPDLLEPLLEDRADLVIGSRVLGDREPGSLSFAQRWGNRLATLLLALLFHAHFTDLGPFRVIRWDALVRLAMRDQDYGWTVEMQARAARLGLRSLEIPVRYRRRILGTSKVSGTLSGIWGASTKILLTLARVRLGG